MLDACLVAVSKPRARMKELQMRVVEDLRALMVFSESHFYGLAPLSEPGQYPSFITIDGARIETRFLRGAIDEAHNHPAEFRCNAANGGYAFGEPGALDEQAAIAWWLQRQPKASGAVICIKDKEFACLPFDTTAMRMWMATDHEIEAGRFVPVNLDKVGTLALPNESVYRLHHGESLLW